MIVYFLYSSSPLLYQIKHGNYHVVANNLLNKFETYITLNLEIYIKIDV